MKLTVPTTVLLVFVSSVALAQVASAPAPAASSAAPSTSASAAPSASASSSAAAAAPAAPAPITNEDCLKCHSNPATKRASGKPMSVVDPKAYAASIHGQQKQSCTDCHGDLSKAVPGEKHAAKVAPVSCKDCHDKQQAEWEKSLHANAIAKDPNSKAASCDDCHGMHDIRGPKDLESSVNIYNLQKTCMKCHGDPAVFKASTDKRSPTHFDDSIHGKALQKSGLSVAPTCSTCHGVHDVRKPSDPTSPVSRANVPATCGKCHALLVRRYEEGIHGQMLKAGNAKAPICTTCHTTHGIKAAMGDDWKVAVIAECGTCHDHSMKTYRDTYHGQVTAMGFTRVASCADCHDSHAIFKASDPRSTVSAQNRVKTCQKCHPGVNQNFANYDPHANVEDKSRNQLLFFTGKFMKWLLLGVFSFFGLHTLLWFPRSYIERMKHKKRLEEGEKGAAE